MSRTTLQASTPPGVGGCVALDWKDGRLAGIEILDASSRLHHDLLDQADDQQEKQRRSNGVE